MSVYNSYLSAAKAVLPEFASEKLAEKLSVLADFLEDAGGRMNLTAVTEPEAVVWLHLIDSLYAARFIAEIGHSLPGKNIADIGSGGGFPALPVAAALPEFSVCAVDSTEKKCAYIKDCAKHMGLGNVAVQAVRAEDFGRTAARESFAVVTARAVARLNVLLELCLPLTAVGGVFLAMKGAAAGDEAAEGRRAAELLGAREEDGISYFLPGFADSRRILVYRKISATPDNYPRLFAKISKSPL